MTLDTLNYLVGIGTVGIQLFVLLLLGIYFWGKPEAFQIVRIWAMPTALLLTVGATILSLVYSMYFGLQPCPLCWMQRVFLYPQIILLGMALVRRESVIALYSIALSVAGAVVAFYQHLLQMGGSGSLPCQASGTVDCARRFLFEFGYITFPLATFSTFVLLIVLMLFVWKDRAQVK